MYSSYLLGSDLNIVAYNSSKSKTTLYQVIIAMIAIL